MPSMTIKSIPDKIYQNLKRNARLNHRSLNGEVIACLERSLGVTQPSKETVLSRIDEMRQSLKGIKVTDRVLLSVKNNGRL